MTEVDEPGAIPMFVDESRVFIGQNNHTFLVLHKTASAGTAQDIAHFFATDPAEASTHYIIGQDGTIVQCVQEKDGAAGNCCEKGNFASFLPIGQNLNNWSVSIEHCDPTDDNSTPLTDAQKSASFKLIQHICQRHNIPMRRAANDGQGGIIGHDDIDPVDRANCPGNYPWNELWAYLEGGNNVGIPTNWHDNGATLTDPNGKTLGGAIRTTILAGNWQPDDVVMGSLRFDQPGQSVLLEDGRWGNGDLILFSKSAIAVAWKPDPALTGGTQETNVTFLVPTGNELLWARRELNDAHQQIAALQAQIAAVTSPTIDITALVDAINKIPDAIAQPVADALIKAKALQK